MPSTLSSAATKCISEVPGLAKQVSIPDATSVRTRLSDPFMPGPWGRGYRSMRQQDRHPAGPDDLAGGAAEDHLAPRRPAIAAHDEEIGGKVMRRREQQLAV